MIWDKNNTARIRTKVLLHQSPHLQVNIFKKFGGGTSIYFIILYVQWRHSLDINIFVIRILLCRQWNIKSVYCMWKNPPLCLDLKCASTFRCSRFRCVNIISIVTICWLLNLKGQTMKKCRGEGETEMSSLNI